MSKKKVKKVKHTVSSVCYECLLDNTYAECGLMSELEIHSQPNVKIDGKKNKHNHVIFDICKATPKDNVCSYRKEMTINVVCNSPLKGNS